MKGSVFARKYFWISSGLFSVSVLFILLAFSNEVFTEDQTYQEKFQEKYSIFSVVHPDTLYFAGERAPLENFDVKESYDKELLVNTYWQSQTMLFIKRSNRYFPIIEPILKEQGVPDDFKYLAIAESGLTQAVSPARAVGFWQFLKETGREYGLEINSEVDERYHIEKATEAACKYFKKAYDKFGSWTMAAASYNNGRRGLLRQVNIQQETNYYNLLLNEETGRYVYRILAIKTILENPRRYGFYYREKDLYPAFETREIEVDTAVRDFAGFAAEFNLNYKILKFFNPWLRKPYLVNAHEKPYFIKIPVSLPREFIHEFHESMKDTLDIN
jgi:hypothetical protein